MQHTLVAVFDNRSDAQRALEDLVASGFSRQETRLSEDSTSGQDEQAARTGDDQSITSSIRHFFTDVFGTDRDQTTQMYQQAVNRGHYVLRVNADSEPEVERAADIVERYGPVDIDEQASQAGAFSQEAIRMDSSSQQGASLSQQSATSQTQGSMQGNLQDDLTGVQQGSQQRADTSTAIPVIQEELKVGKREVQRGGVRIYQRIIETPVSESIGLREEHVNVERHAVDRPATAADVNAFQETTIELRETAEEAVVEKSARVVEEVVVGTEVTQRNEQITDTVRRTEVEIEQLSADDDAYFRGHWTSNYANDGAYEDYAPAYSYGSSMARSELYRGRPWNDVEGPLRSDWESRNPNSGWEKFKAAIRHGWERITS